jgi:hypothetical protein
MKVTLMSVQCILHFNITWQPWCTIFEKQQNLAQILLKLSFQNHISTWRRIFPHWEKRKNSKMCTNLQH